MPEPSRGPRGRPAPAVVQDQAAGLRRLFEPAGPQWLPVVLAPGRDLDNAPWLARLARACVEQGARTLVVDAARAQVASAFGVRARYDLAHAFSGDCAPLEACAAADANLRILPAARALERFGKGAGGRGRFEAGVRALAAGADCALLVLPPSHARSLAAFCRSDGASDAIVVTGPGSDAGDQVIGAMRAILSVADIETFRLLFQGSQDGRAGRLYSRLAATGIRDLGVRTSNAGSVDDARALERLVRQVRCGSAPGGDRIGKTVETVS